MQSGSLTGSPEKNGVIAAFISFAIWGVMPLYWRMLAALSALEIISHRILWSFFFILIFLLLTGKLGSTLKIFRQPKNILVLFATSLCLAGNWLVYIWAINSNQVLEVSLGYFINPLLNIFMGRIFFGDRLNTLSWISILIALGGVAYQVHALGSLPMVALLLGVSFALYGLFRKIAKVESLPGLFIESTLLLPFAAFMIFYLGYTGTSALLTINEPKYWLYVIFLGPASCIPLAAFTYAARRIRLTTLGLLQYLAPSINFILGIFVFHEVLTIDKLVTFCCIWIALALYSWDNLRLYNLAKNRGS